MRGKFETFLFIFLVMLFVAGLSLALYPYVQGAIVDGIMERQSEEFLSRVEIIGDTPKKDEQIIVVTEPEETEPRQHLELWEEMTAYKYVIRGDGQTR